MNIESFRKYCLSLPFATEDMPFNDTSIAFRLKNKIFAFVDTLKPNLVVLKSDPQKAIELREHYSCIEGAFHWNKKYWNQIWIDQLLEDDLLRRLINHSWNEVNKKLPMCQRETPLDEETSFISSPLS